MSLQKQIRLALVALLTQGFPDMHVFQAPRRQLDHPDMPSLSIFSHEDRPLNDEDDQQRSHIRCYTVRVELRVESLVEDDATDDLAVRVRQCLMTESLLGGLALRITWSAQQWDGAEGETPMAGTALDFNIHYLWRPE